MTLLVNRQRLDLKEGTSLQFTKKNALFAFDELCAERTTSFNLPATPTNDAVLGVARVPAYVGTGMRKRFAAEVQDGTVVKHGYLYVSKYDDKNGYDAVFVGGHLFDLKTFGNYQLGSIIWNQFYTHTVYNADAANIPTVARVRYRAGEGVSNIQPSFSVGGLLQQINAQGILPIVGVTDTRVRVIRKGENLRFEQVLENLINTSPTQAAMDLSCTQRLVQDDLLTVDYSQPGNERTTAAWKFTNDVLVTFPDDTPENLCICTTNSAHTYPKITFIGSRQFLRPATSGGAVRYTGAPLAGQTVAIPMETVFILMTGAGAPYNASDPTGTNIDWAEIDFDREPAYNVAARIACDGMETPDGIPFSSMFTDVSIGDLLKLYSVTTGTLIGVDRNGAIHFYSDQFSGASPVEPKIESIEEISRTFSDWAQRNWLRFKESELVLDYERKATAYTVPNEGLELDKDILTLEFVEGGQYTVSDQIMIRGIEDGLLTDDFAARTGDESYLKRVSLVKSDELQSICTASTQIKVAARMPLFEFSRLESGTVLLVKNTEYSWVEASWQNNTCTMTLARIL